MLCCSPHLFGVVTLPQENKVPFNYACTCESVPLTAAIMLMIKTYRLTSTEETKSNSIKVTFHQEHKNTMTTQKTKDRFGCLLQPSALKHNGPTVNLSR